MKQVRGKGKPFGGREEEEEEEELRVEREQDEPGGSRMGRDNRTKNQGKRGWIQSHLCIIIVISFLPRSSP